MDSARADVAHDRSILPWRFVVGVMLHVALPVYIMVLGAALIPGFGSNAWRPAEALLRASLWFLPGYAAATVVAGIAAWLIAPWLRRRQLRRASSDGALDARVSEQRLITALAAGRRLKVGGDDSRLQAILARLEAGKWQHGEPQFQLLSDHLARAVSAFAAAIETAESDRRPELVAMAATALDHIASELDRLTDAQGRVLDETAEVMARYTAYRFAASDFASDRSG